MDIQKIIQKKEIGNWTTYFTSEQMFHIHNSMFIFAAEHTNHQKEETADMFYGKLNRMEVEATQRMCDKQTRLAAYHANLEAQEPYDEYPRFHEEPDPETDVDETEYFNVDEQNELRQQRCDEGHQQVSSWLLRAHMAAAFHH